MAPTPRQPLVPLAALVLVVACSGGPTAPSATPTATGSSEVSGSPTQSTGGSAPATSTAPSTSAAPSPSPATATAQPTTGEAWRSLALTDVRSGETIRAADFAGKLLVIEPMAIWCTNCRAQQDQLREALATLDRPAEIVALSLDVDRFEVAADLASYADQRDYPWHFAIAGADMSRAIAAAFGDTVLSPPSTPKIIVAPDGTAELVFGHRSADELVQHFRSLLP